jgi:hypothetical protein
MPGLLDQRGIIRAFSRRRSQIGSVSSGVGAERGAQHSYPLSPGRLVQVHARKPRAPCLAVIRRCARLGHVVAAAGGDLVGSGQLQDSDGEVSQGGHDPQSVAGADLGGVLVVGDVADVVQGFDAPVAADPLGCSPVLADQALDGLSALDPGG